MNRDQFTVELEHFIKEELEYIEDLAAFEEHLFTEEGQKEYRFWSRIIKIGEDSVGKFIKGIDFDEDEVTRVVEILMKKARALYDAEEYGEAGKQYELGLQFWPDNTNLMWLAGEAYQRDEQWVWAEQYYKKVVEVEPKNVPALANLGKVYNCLAAGTPDSAPPQLTDSYYVHAIGVLERAVKIEPGHSSALFELGLAYAQMDERAKAEGMFERANLSQPGNGMILHWLAGVKCEVGKYSEALKNLQKALSVEPDNALLCNNISFCYYKLGDMELAKEFISKAVEVAPEVDLFQDNYAIVFGTKEGEMVYMYEAVG